MEKASDKAIIKPFIYKNNYYVYDAYTNMLVKLTKEDYKKVNELERIGMIAYQNKYQSEFADTILHLSKKGYFSTNFINRIENPYINDYLDLLNGNVMDLTLQITCDCNFKCRYCSYSTDNDINRVHSNAEMSWDIAQKSIDFLFEHSAYSDTVVVAFYGGEPLLNFDLIKKVVDYANTKFQTKKVKYVMTVNGSLLTPAINDYLVLNNFSLTISFDGPKSLQNQHRRLRHNGQGSYDLVIKNVADLKNRHLDYFRNKVSFISVLFEDETETDVIKFLQNELGIESTNILVQSADMAGIDYYLSYKGVNNNLSGKNSRVEKRNINLNMEKIYDDKSPILPVWCHRGPCVPGIKRLFVDINGNLFPCEKCLEAPALMIGNIFTGFNIEKISEYINIGKLSEENCKQCWALRYCEICALRCFNLEEDCFDLSVKNRACYQEKEKTMLFLQSLIDKKMK